MNRQMRTNSKSLRVKNVSDRNQAAKADGGGAPSSVHNNYDVPLTVITVNSQLVVLLNLPPLLCEYLCGLIFIPVK